MLRRLRRSSRLMAPFVVAISAMVLLGSLDWWHADDDDSAGIVVFHDHSAHHPLLRGDHPVTRAQEHCYLCHWLRTLHSGLQLASNRAPAPTDVRHIHASTAPARSISASNHLPARAPPV